MRAAKVFALVIACSLAAICISLFQEPGGSLGLFGFFGEARADSGHDSATAFPSSPDPGKPASPRQAAQAAAVPPSAQKAAPLPDFVPQPRALSQSDTSPSPASSSVGEDPEGPSPPTDQPPGSPEDKTTTGSVSTPSAQGGGKASASSSSSSVVRPVSIKVEPIPSNELPKTPVWPKFVGAKTLFGEAKVPAPLEARAIGSYARGCLSGAVPLPIDGPAWQEMRLSRNRNWGHPKLIALIEKFAKDAQKLDGWPGLLVGDIAQPRGGPMITGHASHQIGLDADIWLTAMPNRTLTRTERENIQATSMLDKTELAVDRKIFTEKQVALIKRAASYPEVERIFVHPAIKKALCQMAGTDRAWLGKVRPWYGHYYHFHVRMKCPEGMTTCAGQPPPSGDDGCGKEVDQWLSKVIPSKVPLEPRAPSPGAKPRVPIMLSDLPKECQAVLAAGPEPVAIPKAALLTQMQARKTLAKAEAVNLALARASAVSGSKPSADSLVASPALRPHLNKAATADPK